EDTGIGIEKEELERIFDGFYRSPAAKASGVVGTGLGLSIVTRLAERLGGTVSVASEQGNGSRFTVRLPLANG
ncbi:MAG: ATP-binding protein, partial [Desulfobacterales bacterium]|nr:ATP-binding protein [Desulfobacterales bacterium]